MEQQNYQNTATPPTEQSAMPPVTRVIPVHRSFLPFLRSAGVEFWEVNKTLPYVVTDMVFIELECTEMNLVQLIQAGVEITKGIFLDTKNKAA